MAATATPLTRSPWPVAFRNDVWTSSRSSVVTALSRCSFAGEGSRLRQRQFLFDLAAPPGPRILPVTVHRSRRPSRSDSSSARSRADPRSTRRSSRRCRVPGSCLARAARSTEPWNHAPRPGVDGIDPFPSSEPKGDFSSSFSIVHAPSLPSRFQLARAVSR